MMYGINRTVCDVLREMRECNKTRNYSYLNGLVEEVQTMVNRMEAALYDQKDLKNIRVEIKEKQEELKQLEKEIKDVKGSK